MTSIIHGPTDKQDDRPPGFGYGQQWRPDRYPSMLPSHGHQGGRYPFPQHGPPQPAQPSRRVTFAVSAGGLAVSVAPNLGVRGLHGDRQPADQQV